MTIHKLQRSGNAPLLIDGDLLADVDGKRYRNKDRNRWHRIMLFRTATGYAARVAYYTAWDGESEWHSASEFRNLAQLVEWLGTCRRQPDAIGYPIGEQFETRQSRLLAELDAEYSAIMSEVLDADGLDWTHDAPPSDGAVRGAVAVLNSVLGYDSVLDTDFCGGDGRLEDAITIIQAAKVSSISQAVRDRAAEYDEEVPVEDSR